MRISQIEAEPNPSASDLDRTALVIIDMQRDFLEKGGFGKRSATTCRACKRRSAPARRSSTPRAAWNAGHPYSRRSPARSE